MLDPPPRTIKIITDYKWKNNSPAVKETGKNSFYPKINVKTSQEQDKSTLSFVVECHGKDPMSLQEKYNLGSSIRNYKAMTQNWSSME